MGKEVKSWPDEQDRPTEPLLPKDASCPSRTCKKWGKSRAISNGFRWIAFGGTGVTEWDLIAGQCKAKLIISTGVIPLVYGVDFIPWWIPGERVPTGVRTREAAVPVDD